MEQKLTQANEQYLAAQEKYDAKIRKLEDEKRRLNEEVCFNIKCGNVFD